MGAISFRESSGTEPEHFVVACYTGPDCLPKGCTKFTLLLVMLFENNFHTDLQSFPWIRTALPGRFSAEAHREKAERRLSRAGCVGLAEPSGAEA